MTMSRRRLRRPRPAGRGLLCLGLFLGGAAAAPTNSHAKVKGRFFGDFSIGGGYDDSVFRDASKRKDGLGLGAARVGWGGRLARPLVGQLDYNFRSQIYVRETRESFTNHEINAALRWRLLPRLSLELPIGVSLLRQPNLPTFNSLQGTIEPGLRFSAFDNTRLEAAFIYETRSFQNFDLDRRGPGFSGGITQDIGLNLSLIGRYRQVRGRYTERALFKDKTGEKLSELRRETEREGSVGLRYNLGPASLRAGYEWSKLSSNGNFLDFGPNQNASANTILGDERLVSNYYSFLGKGPMARIGLRAGAVSLLGSFQWQRRNFGGRFAKNSADQFVAGDPLRRDTRRIYTASLGRMRRSGKILIGFSLDFRHENSTSNDSLYTFKNNSASFSFRFGF